MYLRTRQRIMESKHKEMGGCIVALIEGAIWCLLITVAYVIHIWPSPLMGKLEQAPLSSNNLKQCGMANEATSLGHVEINFLKSNVSDLVDVWVPLQEKLSQACQSKLRLRIFLKNKKGGSVVKDYLSKLEEEVGTKGLDRAIVDLCPKVKHRFYARHVYVNWHRRGQKGEEMKEHFWKIAKSFIVMEYEENLDKLRAKNQRVVEDIESYAPIQ
ncbi:hypothetical protein K2173_026210 [Erythroxylum novogranatense]|uniref:Uncharacterized protein n=1 Tax=Erythroxylum novogranatense TaxID=1862640 RepID=A0AAV8SBF6_9ROSI|nr:hypothetical protein K2173_026210 [Erythroxylum novogranatense]